MTTLEPATLKATGIVGLPRCDVWLRGRRIARLYRENDFKHVLVYEAEARSEDFVSLTMPVRPASWDWPELHPFFRMNLPEGYQLKLLQEAFGSLLDGTELTLLGLVGANGIGRVRVTPADQRPQRSPEAFDLRAVLKGDNREAAFQELLRRHLLGAVSGVVPKFLSPPIPAGGDQAFLKASIVAPRAIVKGGSEGLPYLALNEHLSMAVAARAGLPTAKTQLSDDGLAIAVERFDTDEQGEPALGLEDFCSLLGMRPAEKYDTTWERIARALREYTPAVDRAKQFEQLVGLIVLTYVVRNADCHSKNVALVYNTRDDVRLAPVYDVVTTVAYDDFRNSPPGLSLAGRKTWQPGKSLERFAVTVGGLAPKTYRDIVDRTCQAAVEVVPEVTAAMKGYAGFREIGKRILSTWEEGIRDVSTAAKSGSASMAAMKSLVDAQQLSPASPKPKREAIGRSELLGRRK